MKNSVTMVGVSAAIRGVEEEIDHAARSDAKVLITGESGVGKEIVARLIHERSNRAARSARHDQLRRLSRLAARVGAVRTREGQFHRRAPRQARLARNGHGGTIFMDEVGEMSLRMQALLLRFLETGEIQRVGSDRRLPPLDVRVITATHRRLIEHIADKTFREDLYYRLNVVHIEVPPLRDRREDIFVLLNHFLRDVLRDAPDAGSGGHRRKRSSASRRISGRATSASFATSPNGWCCAAATERVDVDDAAAGVLRDRRERRASRRCRVSVARGGADAPGAVRTA